MKTERDLIKINEEDFLEVFSYINFISKSVTLTEEEISLINSYVEEVSELPIVESVFVVAYNSIYSYRPFLEINSVINNSVGYNFLLTNNKELRRDCETDEIKSLLSLMEKYNELCSKNINFGCSKYSDYPLISNTKKYIDREKVLLDSTIVFDRFNRISHWRDFFKNRVNDNYNGSNGIKINNEEQIIRVKKDNPVLEFKNKRN